MISLSPDLEADFQGFIEENGVQGGSDLLDSVLACNARGPWINATGPEPLNGMGEPVVSTPFLAPVEEHVAILASHLRQTFDQLASTVEVRGVGNRGTLVLQHQGNCYIIYPADYCYTRDKAQVVHSDQTFWILEY